MSLPIWQVDAFAPRRFAGNPAAVVPLDRWLPPELMQSIAAENNLAETAFIVREGPEYGIRWFTPGMEVPLCGHATLASGWVVLNRLEPMREEVTFHSRSGPLVVRRQGDKLALDLPAIAVEPAAERAPMESALGGAPAELYRGFQWLAVYPNEDEVRSLKPDFAGIVALGIHGVIVTAPGKDCDFVSRFFAPEAGIPEDPVTGSAHSRLVPFWAARLGKTELFARQVSPRGGELWCELVGDRVILAGHAALYLEGSIEV